MEALGVDELPAGAGWQFEPKWDGFRCLLFRSGGAVALQSKSGQVLGRYFPEVDEAAREVRAQRFVLDGEIVLPGAGDDGFDLLLQRIHPAASRVSRMAGEHPASFVAFDLLVDERGRSLRERPLEERRRRLEDFARRFLAGRSGFALSPATRSVATARRWLTASRHGFDGVMAKRLDRAYAAGERTAMQKVKPRRTADCVVGGFRYAQKGRIVGSLLLGLFDAHGLLHHVGFTSSLPGGERRELTPVLERLVRPPGFTGRAPGGPSRWSARSGDWQPLVPELVVEVAFNQASTTRFRHGAQFLRWRPDKSPAQCTLAQLGKAPGRRAAPAAHATTRAAPSKRAATAKRARSSARGAPGSRRSRQRGTQRSTRRGPP
jgi:ATP-dependent DNA ligase